MYKENPKTKGSGIYCAIPQTGICPNGCKDCFFQSGRSYLEPLADNLPNMPPVELGKNHVIRVNDGNDSAVQQALVMEATKAYPMKFYNTSNPDDLATYDAPVVLTLNPGDRTDDGWWPAPRVRNNNLMFVRFRTNTWNLLTCDHAVDYYSSLEVPVVLTFMAYHDPASIPDAHKKYYVERKRTLNTYWAITTAGWEMVMARYKYNKWVYSCGKTEGELGTSACRFCGNCIREYFACMEKHGAYV